MPLNGGTYTYTNNSIFRAQAILHGTGVTNTVLTLGGHIFGSGDSTLTTGTFILNPGDSMTVTYSGGTQPILNVINF